MPTEQRSFPKGTLINCVMVLALLANAGAAGAVDFGVVDSNAPVPTLTVGAVDLRTTSGASADGIFRVAAAADNSAVDEPPKAATTTEKVVKQVSYKPGPADACKEYPAYALRLGFDGPVYMSTNLRGYPGLVFIGQDKSGRRKLYQHPSWTKAGYLAAYVYDRAGNIYVGPSPLVSLWENPPDEQNRIWKIGGQSQIMSPFASLPPGAPPSPQNPFGIMGLAYDCDIDSLYVTSVMGSTPDAEKGRVFRVDLETGESEVINEGQDFFGVGILNTRHEKRLYLGSARTSGVYSVALDGGGNPIGSPSLEFYLSNFPGGANDQVKRIDFTDDNLLKIKGISFHYTLTVASAYPHSEYVFKRDDSGGWQLLAVRRGLLH
jgi:hypothetical protein